MQIGEQRDAWRRPRRKHAGEWTAKCTSEEAGEQMERDDRVEPNHMHDQDLPWWASMDFNAAYVHLQHRRAYWEGMEGPLAIHDHKCLFVLWVAVKNSLVDWRAMELASGIEEAAILAYDMVHLLLQDARRRRILCRCARWLRRKSIPLPKDLIV